MRFGTGTAVEHARRIAGIACIAALSSVGAQPAIAGDEKAETTPIGWIVEDGGTRLGEAIYRLIQRECLDLAARLETEVQSRVRDLQSSIEEKDARIAELEKELEALRSERSTQDGSDAAPSGAFLGIDYLAQRGVDILSVHRNSPADLAGLLPGDRLLSIDGVAVNSQNLATVLAEKGADEVVGLRWRRGDDELENMIRLVDRFAYERSRAGIAVHAASPPRSDEPLFAQEKDGASHAQAPSTSNEGAALAKEEAFEPALEARAGEPAAMAGLKLPAALEEQLARVLDPVESLVRELLEPHTAPQAAEVAGTAAVDDANEPTASIASAVEPREAIGSPITNAEDEFLGLDTSPDCGGLRVRGVERGSIAEKLGIREGDILVELNGRPLDEKPDLTFATGDLEAEKEAVFVILRDEVAREARASIPAAAATNGTSRDEN